MRSNLFGELIFGQVAGGERLPAAFDQRVRLVVCGGAAPAYAIGVEVLPGRIAVTEAIVNLLGPSREPGLELAAALSNAGRGDAVLLWIGESVRQRSRDGIRAAYG